MADESSPIPSPADFPGDFGGFMEAIQEWLEAEYGEDAKGFQSVEERAVAETPYVAAKAWLLERWGAHFPCPVCENTQWTVSGVAPAGRPVGYLSFYVTCEYCGNTLHVVPGRAERPEPIIRTEPGFPDK